MQKSDVEATLAKAHELITEDVRSAVVAVYSNNGTVAIHPIGAFQDHALIGNLIAHGAMNAMTGVTKPKPMSLVKR